MDKMETKFILIVAGANKNERLKPALAVTDILRKKGIMSIFAMPSDSVLNKKIIEKGYEIVPVKKFFDGKGFVGNTLRSFQRKSFSKEAGKMISTKNAKGVLTLGGVSSVPILDAAVKMNIKIFMIEQNAVISKSNMEFISNSFRIYLPFSDLESGLDRSKTYVTGIPVEKDVINSEGRNIPTNKKLLVIFSCKRDSNSINDLVRSLFRKYPEMRKEFFVLQETGEKDVASVQRFYEEVGVEALCYMHYENRGKYYKTADVVICRPTSDVVGELIAMKKPGIFLPLPPQYDDYQKPNAVLLNKKGCGYLVEDTGSITVRTKKLYSILNLFLKDSSATKHIITKLEFEKAAFKVAEDIERRLSERN